MKTKRNLIPIWWLCAAMLPAVVQAQFTYTTNNNAITITGYTGPGGNVTIPSTTNGYPVTTIGHGAFYGKGLTSVVIPDSVTSIGGGAFSSCYSLKSVTIPNSVTSIGSSAFDSCYSLKSVTIGSGVTSIGFEAFYPCSSLTNIAVDAANPSYASAGGVLFDKTLTTLIEYPEGLSGSYTIPTSVTSIGSDAFNSCSGLTSVTIPNSVTSIGSDAFSGCSGLTSVTIPNSITSIGNSAFDGCTGLISVTIPNSVTSIGGGAFYYCTGLTNLTIGTSVTIIDNYAFGYCSGLTSVTIPNSVTSLGQGVFFNCNVLKTVCFRGNAPDAGTDIYMFSGDNSAIVYYLPGTTGWGLTYDGRPTALWFVPNPLILNNNPSFGVQSNQFGFTISWATNRPVVIETCTNLANPVWTPVTTNALRNGTNYFSDPHWTNYPGRFYRLRSP